MAFAIHLKTESGDDYVFAFDGEPKQEVIISTIKKRLGDEFEYIIKYNVDETYKIDFKI